MFVSSEGESEATSIEIDLPASVVATEETT
jgi:hypothetical protein